MPVVLVSALACTAGLSVIHPKVALAKAEDEEDSRPMDEEEEEEESEDAVADPTTTPSENTDPAASGSTDGSNSATDSANNSTDGSSAADSAGNSSANDGSATPADPATPSTGDSSNTTPDTPKATPYVSFIWQGKEVFREDIQDGKKVFWYTDDTKTKQVAGSPVTVDASTLEENMTELLKHSDFYKAGYTVDWKHEFDSDGNLLIWPVYTEATGNSDEAVKDEVPYTFKFKWYNKDTDKPLNWVVESYIKNIMSNQPVNKISSDQVKDWLSALTPDRTTIFIDENTEWATPELYGVWEYVGVKDELATGYPKGSSRSIDNIGYYRHSTLEEYKARKEAEEKAKAEAEEKARQEAEAKAKAEAEAKAATETETKSETQSTLKQADAKAETKNSEVKTAKTAATPKHSAKKTATALPQTGDVSSAFGLVAGLTGLASAAAAALLRRKRS